MRLLSYSNSNQFLIGFNKSIDHITGLYFHVSILLLRMLNHTFSYWFNRFKRFMHLQSEILKPIILVSQLNGMSYKINRTFYTTLNFIAFLKFMIFFYF